MNNELDNITLAETDAAWAIVIGSVVTGGLWVLMTGWVYFRSAKTVKSLDKT